MAIGVDAFKPAMMTQSLLEVNVLQDSENRRHQRMRVLAQHRTAAQTLSPWGLFEQFGQESVPGSDTSG